MRHFALLFLFSLFIFLRIDMHAQTEQSLNEYKIEQLQKGIEELKRELKELEKDIEDTKDTKIENKKDNESLDKRIGDINFNITTFAIFITVLLLGFGFFGYRNAKSDAKKEAEDTTKHWIEKEGKEQLNTIVQELQKKSEEEFSQLVKEKTNELNTLFEDFKQEHKEQLDKHEHDFKQLKEQYTDKEKEEIEKDAKISQEKAIKTFDDFWNIMIEHYSNNEFDDILSVINEAERLENLTDNQKGQLYFTKGLIYKVNGENKKAEEYYLKAIEAGNNSALNNLGNLYKEQKEYEKAEAYYKKAIEAGNNDALNSLSWMYFELKKDPKEALDLIRKSYEINKGYENTHTLAVVLLWNEEFTKSYERFEEWIAFERALESLDDISIYLNLLISKGQYYKAKEYLENEKYQLKDRVKPIWYALMTLMQKEFPNEIKMMGSELQESVDDVLKTIEELKQKYKI